jgi:predicted kinase
MVIATQSVEMTPVLEGELCEAVSGDGRATLYLMIGLPGAGKTTRAKEIKAAQGALRLTPDDWILALYGHELDRPRRNAVREPVEGLQWELAQRALALGCNVVLDWGFWCQDQRSDYRARGEALGTRVRLVALDAAIEELWARITRRPTSMIGTLAISRAELDEWAASYEPPTADELA